MASIGEHLRRRIPGESPKFVNNIMHFGRALRAAGLPIGTGRLLDSVKAATHVGLGSREDLYWTLHGLFISRPEDQLIFDRGFHLFWRRPELLKNLLLLDPLSFDRRDEKSPSKAGSRRLGEAMSLATFGADEKQSELVDQFGASSQEVLGKQDFDKMSSDEIAEAKSVIKNLSLSASQCPTRRYKIRRNGAVVDARASIRASLRGGRDMMQLRYRHRRWRSPPVVMICDVSGSMSRYSRLFLHFGHALASYRSDVHAFVFGTQLTNVTRHLRRKDPDEALDNVLDAVYDWSGGTRIGQSLHRFNHDWSRRVLGQGTIIILISDGLERDDSTKLEAEMERLRKSCDRLVWLNPLLRYAGFEAKSRGIRAMLSHVDDFLPAHNLESMAGLVEILEANVRERFTH